MRERAPLRTCLAQGLPGEDIVCAAGEDEAVQRRHERGELLVRGVVWHGHRAPAATLNPLHIGGREVRHGVVGRLRARRPPRLREHPD